MHVPFTAIAFLEMLLLFLAAEFRLAVVQLQVTSVKADNLSRARALVKEAAAQGSTMVMLPVRAHFHRLRVRIKSSPAIFVKCSQSSDRAKCNLQVNG